MESQLGVVLDPKESIIPIIELKALKGKNYGEICFLGDWHLGSGNFSLGQYLQYLSFLMKNPEIKVITMGDLIEMGSLSPYGASEEKVGSMQLMDIITLLTPLKERIVLLLEGNHEERFWKATKGTDSVSKSIADALHIKPLLPGPERGQLFIIKCGAQAYSVYAIHGSTGSTVNKASQLSRIYGNIRTSLVVHGHNHQIFKDHRTYYGIRKDGERFYTMVGEQYWLTTGCLVKNLGYAERTSLQVNKIGCPFVRFYDDKDAIEIIDDPRITYNIGSLPIDTSQIGLEGMDLSKYEERVGFGGTKTVTKRKWEEVDLKRPSKKSPVKIEKQE
jgi:hypothetical protein